eukprot:g6706.t1
MKTSFLTKLFCDLVGNLLPVSRITSVGNCLSTIPGLHQLAIVYPLPQFSYRLPIMKRQLACVAAVFCVVSSLSNVVAVYYNGVEHQNIGDAAFSDVHDEIYSAIDEVIGKYNTNPKFKDKIFPKGEYAEKKSILLPNSLLVSFGDAVALAGDFYGLPEAPISLGKTYEERLSRFYKAYQQFSITTTSKVETPLILNLIKTEKRMIRKFKKQKKLPSDAWKTDKLGFEHEMSFARVTRSDKKLRNKMIRVMTQQAEETKTSLDKKKKALAAKAEVKKKSKGWWEKIKNKMSAFHRLAVDKVSHGIEVVASKLGQYDDLIDKDARYLALAKANFDHFMPNSIKVYKAGHQLAIASMLEARSYIDAAKAAEAKGPVSEDRSILGSSALKFNMVGHVFDSLENLKQKFRGKKAEFIMTQANMAFNRALALEGMANHFLTDMFATGHVRTPRYALHKLCGGVTGGLLSKCSHDQDNKLGLNVENKDGAKWFAQGDSMYFDGTNKRNRKIARKTVAVSIRELLYAFKTGKVGPIPTKVSRQALPSKRRLMPPGNTLRWAMDILFDTGKTGYSASSIEFKALNHVPNSKLSEKLNKRPPMFIAKDGGVMARREEQRFNPSVGGKESAYHYTELSKYGCQLELLKQNCDVV